MASTKYTYSISNDFTNQIVNPSRLSTEIGGSSIITALDYINTFLDDCDIWFKAALSGGEETTLSGVVAAHTGEATGSDAPTMADGRPIVMANSRPVGYQTMFTMAGDTASGIGDGAHLEWDFSNDDYIVASGINHHGQFMKQKRLTMSFLDNVYVKEGCLYFHGAKKGSFVNFDIVCPSGAYYYDRDLNPTQASEDTIIVRYVNRHHFYGDCPMGDELNTESATENAIPSNYVLAVDIFVPESDNDSYGYGELEIYRERTILLPGESP
jgi:hypothetical protein